MAEITNSHLILRMDVEKTLSADWRELIASITNATTDLFLKGSADSLSTGISGLIKFVTSFNYQDSPGNLLWILTISSTAWSFEKVGQLNDEYIKKFAKDFRKEINFFSNKVREEGIQVSVDFFQRPTTLPIYRELTDRLIKGIAEDISVDSLEIRYRIDRAFTKAVFELLTKKIEYYNPLLSALSVPHSPGADLAMSWDLYRASLIYEFEVKPIFGQEHEKISLQQLYIPLRGEVSDEDSSASASDEIAERKEHKFVMIEDELVRWIRSENNDDWLRLIGGGPGSGKSTTLKAIASKMAKVDFCRPLFVPLQHIAWEGDLRKAVDQYFTDTSDSHFTQAPLSRQSVEDGAPLLIIFDGLDELAAPGEPAKEVVVTFANRLQSLVASLSGSANRKIRVIVSGRMPAFQAASRQLAASHGCAIETCGFLPRYDEEGGVVEGFAEDQRVVWWSQYAKLKSENVSTPRAFQDEKFDSLTNEPLLCYLIALSGYANERWELAADNRNRIYASLIESIYERGWGDGAQKRLGPGKTLTKEDFFKLMETVALAAWLGGDSRVASNDKFFEAIEITEAERAWELFTDDNGEDVANLAMNFYLKAADKSQRGFEFTHKSFGEYLASRALINIASEVSKQVPRRIDIAMQDWFKATKSGRPSQELLSFLRDEMRLRLSDHYASTVETSKIKQAFEILIEKTAEDGFALSLTSTSWRKLEIEQGVAECTLWMIVNACAIALAEFKSDEKMITISWNTEVELGKIINRLCQIPGCNIVLQCFSYLNAANQFISAVRMIGCDFSFANLQNVTFVDVNLDGDLSYADLEECRFYLCRVSGNFMFANMNGVNFHRTMISDVRFPEDIDKKIGFSLSTLLNAPGISRSFLENSVYLLYLDDNDRDLILKEQEDMISLARGSIMREI